MAEKKHRQSFSSGKRLGFLTLALGAALLFAGASVGHAADRLRVAYLESAPTIPLEGLRYAIESLVPTVPAAKNLKAESLIDTGILDQAMRGLK
jgi:hypothetical protein